MRGLSLKETDTGVAVHGGPGRDGTDRTGLAPSSARTAVLPETGDGSAASPLAADPTRPESTAYMGQLRGAPFSAGAAGSVGGLLEHPFDGHDEKEEAEGRVKKGAASDIVATYSLRVYCILLAPCLCPCRAVAEAHTHVKFVRAGRWVQPWRCPAILTGAHIHGNGSGRWRARPRIDSRARE